MGSKAADIEKAERILKLKPGYTKGLVLRNFRELSPKIFPSDPTDAAVEFRELCWAYKVLHDNENAELKIDDAIDLYRWLHSKDFFVTGPDGVEKFRFNDSDDVKSLRMLLRRQIEDDKREAERQKLAFAARAAEEQKLKEEAEKAKKKKKKKKKNKAGKNEPKDDKSGEESAEEAVTLPPPTVQKSTQAAQPKSVPASNVLKKPLETQKSASDSDVEDTKLDLNSAFVSQVAQKHAPAAQVPPAMNASKTVKKIEKKPKSAAPRDDLPNVMPASMAPVALHAKNPASMVVAISQDQTSAASNQDAENLYNLALKFRKEQRFQGALTLLDSAVEMNPRDPRYYAARAACHVEAEQFADALIDATKLIALAPDWANGFVLNGKALAGLERHAEAESCFQQALEMEPGHGEAGALVKACRLAQLTAMGFEESDASAALYIMKTVPAAVEFLTGTNTGEPASKGGVQKTSAQPAAAEPAPPQPQPQPPPQVVASKPVQVVPRPPPPTVAVQQRPASVVSQAPPRAAAGSELSPYEDPKNPLKLSTIVVLNLAPSVTESWIRAEFGKCGTILSMRLLAEKHCAFVNYATGEAAGQALQRFHKFSKDGKCLSVRYQPAGGAHKFGGSNPAHDPRPFSQIDCVYWQNTGCIFGAHCRYRHDPMLKGAMLK